MSNTATPTTERRLADHGIGDPYIEEPVPEKPGYVRFVRNLNLQSWFETEVKPYLPNRNGFVMPHFEWFSVANCSFKTRQVGEFTVTVRRGCESEIVSVLARDSEGTYEVMLGKIFGPLEMTWKYVALLDCLLSFNGCGSPGEKADLYEKLKAEILADLNR